MRKEHFGTKWHHFTPLPLSACEFVCDGVKREREREREREKERERGCVLRLCVREDEYAVLGEKLRVIVMQKKREKTGSSSSLLK